MATKTKRDAMTVAQRIRRARTETGLSQERFAEAVGTSRRHVIKWENGQHAPTARFARRIAEVTGRPESEFVDDDDEEAG